MGWKIQFSKRNNFSCASSMVMKCTEEDLWNLLSRPGHLKNIHPLCKDHFSNDWTGVGSMDTILYKNDAKRERSVLKWIPRNLLTLKVVNPINNASSFVEWQISKNHQPNSCRLSVTLFTNTYQNIPRPIWPLYRRFKLEKSYKKYFESVLTGFCNECQIISSEKNEANRII